MPSPHQEILNLFNAGKYNEIIQILEINLNDANSLENEAAWIFGFCFENKISDAIKYAPKFFNRYPNSLYPVRVMFADELAKRGFFDQASNESRLYLRLTLDSGLLQDLLGKPIIEDGVSRAFLLLTSAYTEVGARSYSKRIIELAKKHIISEEWNLIFTNHLKEIQEELKEEFFSDIDNKWEIFFMDGRSFNEIYKICIDKNFTLLAKRIELIKDYYMYNLDWKIDESEIFKLMFTNPAGQYVFI